MYPLQTSPDATMAVVLLAIALTFAVIFAFVWAFGKISQTPDDDDHNGHST